MLEVTYNSVYRLKFQYTNKQQHYTTLHYTTLHYTHTQHPHIQPTNMNPQFNSGYGIVSVDQNLGLHTYAYACPADKVGMVIGNQGRTITNIKHSTGSFVEIRDPQPESARPGPWFIITGFPHQVQAAISFMNNIIDNAQQRDLSRTAMGSQYAPTLDDFPKLNQAVVTTWAPTDQQHNQDVAVIQNYIDTLNNRDRETCVAANEVFATGDFIDQQIDHADTKKLTPQDFEAIQQELFNTTLDTNRAILAPAIIAPNTPIRGHFCPTGTIHTEFPNGFCGNSFEHFCRQNTEAFLAQQPNANGRAYFASTL